MKPTLYAIMIALALPFLSRAQGNYEIQVYGSQTMAKGTTMFELHSNFTFQGSKEVTPGVMSNHHAFHETVEITHGWTTWFETGFYFFNYINGHDGAHYVGSHIRPRVMAPKEWGWPVGASLSIEAGFQKLDYSSDDWTVEIRPIIDKQLDKLYLSFNPTFGKSIHGANKEGGYVFSPNLKAAFQIVQPVAMGIEYYGSLGPLNSIQPYQSQQQQLFIAADFNWSPDWELNVGYGWGLTRSTDNDILKLIVGYRFH